jgi:RNA polymerase sigma-32 factor
VKGLGEAVRRELRQDQSKGRSVSYGRRSGLDEDLSQYMRMARKYPMLDAETEACLARRWRDDRDPEAAERLVGGYQRLVVKIARDYRAYGLPFADLISEGNIGLMQAVDKFDVDRGFRLATYAMWWIRAAVTDYVLRQSSLVRTVTNENRKKLFFNLRRLRAKHQAGDDGHLSPEAVTAIATELGVPEADVIVMDQRLVARDVSVNAAVGGDSSVEWQDFLVSEGDDQEIRLIQNDERDKRRSSLEWALTQLDTRERNILIERKLKDNPPKLAELSVRYGVSRERVRQIEMRAFEKLKKIMLRSASAGQEGPPKRAVA